MRKFHGTIVVKNKGQEVPSVFLEKVIQIRPSCCGAVILDANGVMQTTRISERAEIVGLNEAQKAFKDEAMLMFFGDYGEGEINENDLQPFTLLTDDEDRPMVVAFVEGNFEEGNDPTYQRSPAYHYVSEYLSPKVQKMFVECGLDLHKLMDELRHPIIRRELLSGCTDCAVVLFAQNGEIMSFVKGLNETKFPWGWSSDLHGYEEKSFPDKVEETKPVGFLAGLLGGSKKETKKEEAPPAALTPAPEVIEEKKEDNVPGPVGTIGTELIQKDKDGNFFVMKDVPPNLQGKKRKGWIRHNHYLGVLPQNWENRNLKIPAKPPKGMHPADIKEALKTSTSIPGIISEKSQTSVPQVSQPTEPPWEEEKSSNVTELPQKSPEQVEKILEARAHKDVEAHHLPGIKKGVLPPITREAAEKIQKEFLTNDMLKALDPNSKVMKDPAFIQGLESKAVSFTKDVLGIDSVTVVLGWDPMGYIALCQSDPILAGHLLNQMRIEILKLHMTAKPAAAQTTKSGSGFLSGLKATG